MEGRSRRLKWLWKIKDIRCMINIEPVIILHMMGVMMTHIIITDLLYYQACTIDQHKEISYCKKNHTRDDGTAEIVADINIWRQIIENSFPILLALCFGAWSDIHGRKLPMLVVLCGVVIRDVGMILISINLSVSASTIALISSLPVSLTGGRTVFSMAMHIFVTDTTTVSERTIKTGIVMVVFTFAMSIGNILGAFLKSRLSYLSIFLVAGGFDLIAFIYTLLFIQNTNGKFLQKQKEKQNEHVRNQGDQQGRSVTSKKDKVKTKRIKDFLNFKNVVESGRTFLKKREGQARLQLMLLVVALVSTMAAVQGEQSVMQQFAYKQLGWSTSQYGYYGAFKAIISFIGSLISLGLLVKLLGVGDPLLGLIACISQICGNLIFTFATRQRDWMMYLAPVVNLVHGGIHIATTSMISKIVPKNEIGRINSWVGTLESISRLSADPFYAAIFRWTLTLFTGTFFLVSLGLTIPSLVIFLIFQCFFHLPEETTEENDETNETEKENTKVNASVTAEIETQIA